MVILLKPVVNISKKKKNDPFLSRLICHLRKMLSNKVLDLKTVHTAWNGVRWRARGRVAWQ